MDLKHGADVQKSNSAGRNQVRNRYLLHLRLGESRDISANIRFGDAFGIFAEHKTVFDEARFAGLQEHVSRLSHFLERRGEGENDQIRAVFVANVVLENQTGSHTLLNIAVFPNPKADHVDLPNQRGSLIVEGVCHLLAPFVKIGMC